MSGYSREYNEIAGLRDIAKHRQDVRSNLSDCIEILLERMVNHDESKLSPEERPLVVNKSNLDLIQEEFGYGSREYNLALGHIQDTVLVHYRNNSHHPEHYEEGIQGMNLFDLLEMLCDWMAASDGRVGSSLYINEGRFDIPEPIVKILWNTLTKMGWVEN